MNSENFGKNLEAVMDALGLCQKDVAERTGLTQAAISQILNGKREPSLGTICKILTYLPVKFEVLVK
jgi:transcriptional regulator with XRE-family HTH domain